MRTKFIALGIACLPLMCSCGSKQQSQEQAVEKESVQETAKQTESVEQEKPKEAAFVGTYQFKDAKKKTWTVTIKEDYTATIEANGGKEIHYYSWGKYISGDNAITIDGSQSDWAKIYFPDMSFAVLGIIMQDGRVYGDPGAARAKSPKGSFEVKKLN